MMTVKFLSVGGGDAIHLRFEGPEGAFYNILIDGGTGKGDIYTLTLRPTIQKIISRQERIDLWMITHIDDDHIGGILRLIKDKEIINQLDLSQTRFWYNAASWDYDTGIKDSNHKSVRQGMLLRDYLGSRSLGIEAIAAGQRVPFHGVEFTLLSPDATTQAKLVQKWKREEIKIRSKKYSALKMAKPNDYEQRLEEFAGNIFQEDHSEENRSSIAFLLKYNGKQGLFLADSHPSQIVRSLSLLGYSPTNPVAVSFVKLSHHGSKFNTNDELLSLIDCEHYIISADGITHNLPNKETLARIINSKKGKRLYFYLTHRNAFTTSIFKVDDPKPNIELHFPGRDSNGIELTL